MPAPLESSAVHLSDYRPPIFERFLLNVAFMLVFPVWTICIAWLFALEYSLADVITHTSMHVWVITSFTTFIIFVLVLLRRRSVASKSWLRRFVLLALPLAFLTYIALPWNSMPMSQPNGTGTAPVRIFVWNAQLINFDYPLVEKVIRETDADIVAIIECNAELGKVLEPLRAQYAHSLWSPRWDSQSMIVLSKLPDSELKFTKIAGLRAANVRFSVNEDSPDHNLLVFHTFSPRWPDGRVLARNQQLLAAGDWAIEHKDSPAILMGDFNTSPWSPIFKKLIRTASLCDTRRFAGYYSTWPSFMGDFGIPIDHALTNYQVNVLRRDVLPEGFGSDHRGIILEIDAGIR